MQSFEPVDFMVRPTRPARDGVWATS